MKTYTFLNINDFPRKKHNVSEGGVIPVFKQEKRRYILFKDIFKDFTKKASSSFIPTSTQFFYNTLKTGDLLFVSYIKDILKFNFIKIFCNSVWTHMGIFYKDPVTQESYVMEAAGYNPPYCTHFIKIPFINWLNINRNQAIGVLPLNKEVRADKLMEVKRKLKVCYKNDYYVEDLGWRWIRFVFNKKKSFFKKHKGITCTEYVLKLYKKMGIIKLRYHPSSYFPVSLYKCNNIKFKDGYRFCTPYLLSSYKNNHIIPV